jgi:lambda family phage portal protein
MPIPNVRPSVYSSYGYRAASVARRAGRTLPTGGSGDYHARTDADLLRNLAQEMDRDNAIYSGILNRAADNILGDGFKLQARTGSKKLNQKIEAWWAEEFAPNPEVRGLDAWADLEFKSLIHTMSDGDVAFIKTNQAQLQAIEAERIVSQRTTKGARTERGVELDRLGKPLAYWIADYDTNGYVQTNTASRYAAENVIFLAYRRRFSSTRGVPLMVPAFPMIHRLNDTCDSEAIAWQLLAKFAFTCYRDQGPRRAYEESDENDDGKDQPPSMDVRVQDVDEGTIFHAGSKDHKLEAIRRELPGANFPDAVRAFLRLVGLPVGMPLELILLDWSQTNYSSARAALEQAYRNFMRWQAFLKRSLHRPAYVWRLGLLVQSGYFTAAESARSDFFRHEWIAPKFPWLDVLKEAKAWGEALDRGFTTLADVLATRGMDLEETMDRRAAEFGMAIEKANRINQQYPEAQVDWRELAGLSKQKEPAPIASDEKTDDDEPIKPAAAPSTMPPTEGDPDA